MRKFKIRVVELVCLLLMGNILICAGPVFARRLKHTSQETKRAVLLSEAESRSLGEEIRRKLGLQEIDNPKITAEMKFADTQISVEWDVEQRYCRVGPLIFLQYSDAEELGAIRKSLGEEILDKHGGNIIFYLPADIGWQPQSRNDPFIHATTIPAIAGMLKYGVSGKVVADIGSGYGILSVVALRLGAEKVLAVERNRYAIEKSIEVIKANGYQVASDTLKGEQVEFFNQTITEDNHRSLGLPDEVRHTVQMIVSNTGPLYKDLPKWIIEAGGSWPVCRAIILANYDLPAKVDESDVVVREKISISEEIRRWMEESGFTLIEEASLEFLFSEADKVYHREKTSEVFFSRKP